MSEGQNLAVAARVMAEGQALGHRSQRRAIRYQVLGRPNMISSQVRRL